MHLSYNTGTSLALVPSGRIVVAGFTDGTLRLFDLTGIFHCPTPTAATTPASTKSYDKKKSVLDKLFDDDSSGEESFQMEEEQEIAFEIAREEQQHQSSSLSPSTKKGGRSGNTLVINSHVNQRYGAVACQIHSRGVHTNLLMDVAISEDGLYAFGGVLRGSVELVAVDLGCVEEYIDEKLDSLNKCADVAATSSVSNSVVSILDLIQVDRHADAKLRGFGACTRLWNGWERSKSDRPEYLLLSGKGIKVRKLVVVKKSSFAFFSHLVPILYAVNISEHSHLVIQAISS